MNYSFIIIKIMPLKHELIPRFIQCDLHAKVSCPENSGLVIVIYYSFLKSFISTFNSLDILTNISNYGCVTLEHHLDMFNCSANHFPVFFVLPI